MNIVDSSAVRKGTDGIVMNACGTVVHNSGAIKVDTAQHADNNVIPCLRSKSNSGTYHTQRRTGNQP